MFRKVAFGSGRSAAVVLLAMLCSAGFASADPGEGERSHARPSRVAPRIAGSHPVTEGDPPAAARTGSRLTGKSSLVDAPPNDTCAGAIALPLNRTVVATTEGANDDYQSPATTACYAGIGQTPTTAPGRDIVFSFAAPAAGEYSVRIIQQNPNDDPTQDQNAVLYAADSCPPSGTVDCIAGANRPQSNRFASATGASNNISEEIACLPMTSGQVIYVFFDDAAAGNPGGTTSLEVVPCVREVEPNDTPATANPYQCGILGASGVAPVAHCYLGTRAGQACTRTLPLNASFPDSNQQCSISGNPCTVDASGVSSCGPDEGLCQQLTDLDCDPRCDVGPNAGLPCSANDFCNPVSDRAAVCAGTCQVESVCVDAAGNAGIPCTPVCVGGLFPGRYCSGLTGCPGGGGCNANAMCPSGSSCTRQYNEGDPDFFSLGAPPAGSKVFAALNGTAANDSDWRMRITSPTSTLQFDDDDGVSRNGSNAPEIAGAVTTGSETFIKVSRTAPRPSEPYELAAIVRPPIASAQLEDEAGPSGNDIYYGWPGDVVNANYINNGANSGYVRGSFQVPRDSDCFKFLVDEGDLMDWFGDGNPDRIAGNTSLTTLAQPIIYDAGPAPISNFIFSANPRKNSAANVPGPGLSALTPAVTSSFFQWRATYTGMLEVCFYDASDALGLGIPQHPSPWAGSLSVNCQPLRPAGPGTTTTDVSMTMTGPTGPALTGSFITYTITVTNSSSDIAQEVHLLDTLPPELAFVGLRIDDTLGGNNTACFRLPTLGQSDVPVDCINTSMAPGTTTTYQLDVQVTNCIGAGISVSNTVTIDTVSTDPDVSNDTATVTFDTVEDGTCADLSCNEQNGSCVADLCTIHDHCDAGVCVSDPVDCDDNNLCTLDSCDPTVGCVNDPTDLGGLCDDFNPCTSNTCDPVLFCVFPPAPDGTNCDGFVPCTSSGSCDGQGACVGTSVCDDGNPCTEDTADESNACACSHQPALPGTPCSDGNACTGTGATPDSCDGSGTCVGGQALACDDGDACNGAEACVPATGCVAGTPPSCNDGDVCNGVETCDPATGCVAGTPLICSDGDACNGVETCDPATGCVAGTPVVCVASDSCHDPGTCATGTGVCSNPAKPDGASCEDGDACTTTDACSAGACVGGPPPLCDDGDPCTADVCIPSSGCATSATNLDGTGFSAARIDGRDLVVLADAWNSCPGSLAYNPAANLDQGATPPGNCVDMDDFHLFMAAFGRTCP